MAQEKDSNRSGPRPWITDEELLDLIHDVLAATDKPVVRTADISDETPINYTSTLSRLHSLEDEGKLRCLSTGNSIVWWLSDEDNEDTGASNDNEHTAIEN